MSDVEDYFKYWGWFVCAPRPSCPREEGWLPDYRALDCNWVGPSYEICLGTTFGGYFVRKRVLVAKPGDFVPMGC